MKRRDIFCLPFVALMLVTMVSCEEKEGTSNTPGNVWIKSATFSFFEPEGNTVLNTYFVCDNDGCCYTPPDEIDVITLDANRTYRCHLDINGQIIEQGVVDYNISSTCKFCYTVIGGADLSISCPDMDNPDSDRFCSQWVTGSAGEGYLRFNITVPRNNPTLKESQSKTPYCVELMIPVIIVGGLESKEII